MLFVAVVFMTGSLCASSIGPFAANLDNEIKDISQALAKISGVTASQPIKYRFTSRTEWRRLVARRYREAYSSEEVRLEETALKALGLIPRSYDLRVGTESMLVGRSDAMYDYEAGEIVLGNWVPESLQRLSLVHEVAHANADQAFKLGRFLAKNVVDNDFAMARAAVMEGQAAWLAGEFSEQQSKRSLLHSPGRLQKLHYRLEQSELQFPRDVPLYLREVTTFSYKDGMLFQHAVVEKLGTPGLAEVFRRPPITTQQVFHPEAYWRRLEPVSVPLLRPTGRVTALFSPRRLGELEHRILLSLALERRDAHELASHWRGASYQLFEAATRRGVVLAYASTWNTSASAERFFDAYVAVLQQKNGGALTVTSRTANAIAGMIERRHFEVRRTRMVVQSLEEID